MDEAVVGSLAVAADPELKAVFRSSRDIISLAASVTASGAGLFVGFDDPLSNAEAIATAADEELAETPL